MNPTKRHVLLALAALAAGAATPALAQQAAALDLSAGAAIGQAYLAAHPTANAAALRAELLPNGFTPEAATQLRARASADFTAGRVFNYRGWRLSKTEARLFALLA